MMTKTIDWTAVAERAAGMTDASIHYAIADIIATLPFSDAMDREDGGDRGGYYRDEASIYHAEMATR